VAWANTIAVSAAMRMLFQPLFICMFDSVISCGAELDGVSDRECGEATRKSGSQEVRKSGSNRTTAVGLEGDELALLPGGVVALPEVLEGGGVAVLGVEGLYTIIDTIIDTIRLNIHTYRTYDAYYMHMHIYTYLVPEAHVGVHGAGGLEGAPTGGR
jgi:hypothetical protein